MIKPIPLKKLPNDVVYRKVIYGRDGETFDNDVTITNVALQEKKIRKNVADGFIIVGNAVLFIDAHYSKVNGASVTDDLLVENSEIVFNGKTYVVQEKEKLDYERNKGIHHWELVLK